MLASPRFQEPGDGFAYVLRSGMSTFGDFPIVTHARSIRYPKMTIDRLNEHLWSERAGDFGIETVSDLVGRWWADRGLTLRKPL
jgi:hypothetical protein